MPERGFDTEFWTDSFVQRLPAEAKLLFSYLWTNDHCNQAGLYHITLQTIAFETGLPLETLPELLDLLNPKVMWISEDDLIWVKNFIARQQKSSKFLIAAAKCLHKIKNNGLVKEVVAYNLSHHSISIPYQYNTDNVSISPVSASVTVSSSNKGVGGGGSEISKEIIKCLEQLKGWQADEDEDSTWLQGLVIEIPGFTLADFKACVDYYSGRAPPKHKGIWKNRFRNWMIKKQEFEGRNKVDEKRKGVRPKPQQERVHPFKRIAGEEVGEG